MSILRGAAAEAELDGVQAVEDTEAGAHAFELTRLTSHDFEALNYALFKIGAPTGQERTWREAYFLLRGADAGRDVLVANDDGAVIGVVQCKRLETAISLPAVFREISKTLLMAHVDEDLGGLAADVTYFLSLTHDPAGTVLNFFIDPKTMLKSRDSDIDGAVREVLETYESLAELEEAASIALVRKALFAMRFKLLRPEDFNQWLDDEPAVRSRFFRGRIVVDNAAIDPMREQMDAMARRLEALPFVTDVDLNIIKERIESTPEQLRLTVGFASLFGYPREMFVGDENLRRRIGRLANLMNELNLDYLEWMNEQASLEAQRICDLGAVVFGVHPFARQVPAIYLGAVALNVVSASNGRFFRSILRRPDNPASFDTDAERLSYAREVLLASGKRHLKGDFSEVVGEGEFLEFKMKLIRHGLQGIASEDDMTRLLDQGIAVLKPHLEERAVRLRSLAAKNPSIFIMGLSGIDDPNVVKQMMQSVRALDAAKQGRNEAG